MSPLAGPIYNIYKSLDERLPFRANTSDPASSVLARAQVECCQTLMQLLDIRLEHVCLLIPRRFTRSMDVYSTRRRLWRSRTMGKFTGVPLQCALFPIARSFLPFSPPSHFFTQPG